jgi:trehalose utilization protein
VLSTRDKRLGLKSIAKSLTAGLWMFMASKVVSAAETDAIGRVDTIEGSVHVIRDGEKIALSKDDPILQGDTIITGEDGSVGVTFIDGTVFSLGEDGEMTIDEMIYNKDSQEGKFAANMVKGVFSFISGEIAKTDPEGMMLNTPVGVIGIRGTKIAGVAAAEGNENTISLLPEMGRDGKPIIGELVMTNSSGSVVLNQVGATVQLTSATQAPPPPVVLSKQDIQKSYGKTLTTLSSTVVVKATNDAKAAEQEVANKEQVAEEAKEAAEEAKKIAEETGDKEAIAEAEKLAEVAAEKVQEVEVAKEVVEDIKEVVEIAKQEFEVQKEAFKEFVVDEKPAEEKPQDQEKPADAEEGDDADAPNEEGGEEGDAPQDVAPEGPIEGEGEELLEEGEPELLEGEGEKPPDEVMLEEGPPEGEKPPEEVVVEEAPVEVIEEGKPEQVVEVLEAKPEQVVEVAPEPVIEQPKPIMEAPKPIPIAPIVPDIVFVAPAPEPIMVVHNVVEHYVEPVVEIVYNEPEIIERPKFMAMARPAYIEVVEEVVEEEVEEETVEPQPNLLGVGGTGDTINAALSIGYYSMSNGQGLSKQVAPIEDAGHTAVKMTTLSETELASVDILWAINPSNGSYGSEYTNAVDRIKERVDEGMILVIHDRQVGNAENILFGEEPADIVRKFTNSQAIDVVDENTVVGEGPGGLLTDSSIDGGNSSNHGYTKKDTLPNDSLALLSTSDGDEIVDFAYKYGQGAVIYSSIPLDYYLGGAMPNFKDIYAPNILQFAASLVTDGYSTIQGTNNNDIVAGTANNDTLEGLDGNDTLFGLYGDDTLYGGAGADTLKGGSGSDVYIYKSLSDSPAGVGDTITDYDETNDKIDISNITTTFNIVPSFTGNTNTHEVVYNTNTKLLQMDADGDKAADMEVTLENYSGTFDYGNNVETNYI